MRTFGLLGYPLSHSFSKAYFSKKFIEESITDCTYENFSFEQIREAFAYLKSLPGINGFNITIPHKISVVNYLDSSSEVCRAIGSCNCVKVVDGDWHGFNTDVPAFARSIDPLLKNHHKKALVFGSGGASRAVLFALRQAGIDCQLVSRKRSKNTISYDQITEDIIATHQVLVNTTPLGMFPMADDCVPIPYEAIGRDHVVYDLIYNPEQTRFLKHAHEQGAATKNGLEMLVLQAEESWRIWNDESI